MARYAKIGAAVIGLAILAGCEAPVTASGNAPPLGDYQLLSIGGDDVESYHVTMLLQDGQVAGGGFCNRYSGSQTGVLPALQIGPLAVTRRACIGDRMQRDQAFFDALTAADAASFSNDRLTITGAGPELVFEPHAPETDHPGGE